MELYGGIALVTGASKGIGREIALSLAQEGAMVAINYRNDEEGANKTLKRVNEIGGNGFIVKGDVASYDSCVYMYNECIKKFGKLNILVNNAGISKVGLFMDMSMEDINSLIDTNLKGAINLTHAVLPHMVSRREGSVINISSMWGNVGASCEAIYSSTKGGVNLFTKALGKEMALSGIRVNAIAPGVINTSMNSFLSSEEKLALEEEIPMGKFGEGKDIGDLVVFLASNKSKYITSQVITVDGGYL